MALTRIKSWIPGEILTAADLNGEFNNVINNALLLVSPITANLDFDNFSAIDFRFERFAATQTAANESRAYWQTTEDNLHIDDGTNIRRVPAMASLTTGALIYVGAGATTYSLLALGTVDQVLTAGASIPSWSAAVGNPLQVRIFN